MKSILAALVALIFTSTTVFAATVIRIASSYPAISTFNGAIESIAIIPTNLLKKRVKSLIKNNKAEYPVYGGDDDASIGALVPIKELLNGS